MSVGEPIDFYVKNNFVIEIDGIRRAGFMTCSELSVELQVVELHEGGRSIPHKKPGKQTFPDITLERGATKDSDFYEWLQQAADNATGRGLAGQKPKRNFDIVQLDRDGSEKQRWSVFNAFPSKFVAGQWEAESEDPTVEKVTLSYDYWKRA